MHQYNYHPQYLHYNIPLDWIVNHTPSGFMDRYGLSNVCGVSTINNKILFFDVHDIHFDNGALRKIIYKNIQPFVLKFGDSINYQTNDNCQNAKL